MAAEGSGTEEKREERSIFHTIVLYGRSHRLSSGDHEAYDIMDHDLYQPFESHLTESGARRFRTNLTENNHDWFELSVFNRRGWSSLLVRIEDRTDDQYIWLTTARTEELAAHYEKDILQLEAFRELSVVDPNAFYEYLPSRDIVVILSGSNTFSDRSVYTSAEFEKVLESRMSPEDAAGFPAFIDNMRSGMGDFSMRVKGDVLGIGGIADTLFLCRSVYHSSGEDGVVGVIHPDHGFSMMVQTRERDSLTGLLNKTEILRAARSRLSMNHAEGTTLAIVDVDYFKAVNDTFGHRMGDTVLRKIANLISAEVNGIGEAGRFGGDEFLLVLYFSDEESIRRHLGNLKSMVRAVFPQLGAGGRQALSISIGCASAPKDTDNFDDLFTLADYCVYLAKFKGRDRYIIYTPEKHGTLDQIRAAGRNPGSLSIEREEPPGNIIVDMIFRARYTGLLSADGLITEFADRFRIENVILFRPSGKKAVVAFAAATKGEDPAHSPAALMNLYPGTVGAEQTLDELGFCARTLDNHMQEFQYMDTGIIILNGLLNLPEQMGDLRKTLERHQIQSTVLIHIAKGKEETAILVLNSVTRRIQWNQQLIPYYRIFADLIGEILQ